MRPTLLWLASILLFSSGCDRGVRPELVGKAAPDFHVTDEDRSVSLKDLHGKVVILNFWASWCPPCLEETPSMQALHDKMKDRVTILAVSTDADRDAYLRFLRDQKATFLTVRDASQNSNHLYGTFGFPESYIIDRNGVVRRKIIGPIDWTSPDMIQYLSNL